MLLSDRAGDVRLREVVTGTYAGPTLGAQIPARNVGKEARVSATHGMPEQIAQLSAQYDTILEQLESGRLDTAAAVSAIAANHIVDGAGAVWAYNTDGDLTYARDRAAAPVPVSDLDLHLYVPPATGSPLSAFGPPPQVNVTPPAATNPFASHPGSATDTGFPAPPLPSPLPSSPPLAPGAGGDPMQSVFADGSNDSSTVPPWVRPPSAPDDGSDQLADQWGAGEDVAADEGRGGRSLPSLRIPSSDGFVGRNKYLMIAASVGVLLILFALLGGR